MRQRVMIAMAICTNPDVLIADEPTTALDVTTQARIMEMLGRIVEERRMGVILITHDLGLASTFCDDIHVMYAGRIVESGSRGRGAGHALRIPYSEALLDSICGLDRDVDRPIAAISGQPPLPHQLPSAALPPRCAYAQEVCVDEAPPAVSVREQSRNATSRRGSDRVTTTTWQPRPQTRPRRRAARRRRSPDPPLPPRRAALAPPREGRRRRLARARPRRDGRPRRRVGLGKSTLAAAPAPSRRADVGQRPLRVH
jgi:oligopeptide/dipeptide ABC transporter ATP-binding protein